MEELALEYVLEVAELVGFSVLTTVLGAIGLLAEQIGIEKVAAGTTIGFWYVVVGLLALTGGYFLVQDHVRPRYRAIRSSETDADTA